MTTDPTIPRTALVLGANGRFGLAATQALHAAGWQVIAPLRREPPPGMPDGVRVLRQPLHEAAALARAAAGASIVVYALNPHYTRWPAELLPLASAGMDVATRLGARLLLPGNVYNFGSHMPAMLQEDTAQHADTRKGALRVALEDELQRRVRVGDLKATVLRAGDFFGGGIGNWFDQAITRSLRSGRLVYPGPTDIEHAWAYLPDLTRALVTLAERPEQVAAPYECFHFAGHTLTGAELLAGIETAAASMGLAPAHGWRHAGMPWRVLKVGGLVVPMWRELAEMAYLWTTPHRLLGSRLERAIGAGAPTPLHDALRASLRLLGHGGPQAGAMPRLSMG